MATTYPEKAGDVQFGRSIRPELRVLDTVRDDKGLTVYWEDGSSEHFSQKKVDKFSPENVD